MSSKITGWLMAKMRNGTAEVPINRSRERAIQGLVRSYGIPWKELKAQGWAPMEFHLKPVNNDGKKTRKNPPLLQGSVLTHLEEERMNRAKEKLELLTQSKKALTITTLTVIFVISIFNIHQALASTETGFFCTERPWACEYTRDVVRESVRTPVLRKFNHPGGRHDLVPELAAKVGSLVPALAAKVQEIVVDCGSKLISGFRPHAVVAGTHRASLHSYFPSRAADLRGNASCMYALIRNWPGGASTDYNRVKHLHLSYDPHGREWGVRFVHGGGHHHHYAQHRRQLRG